MQPHPYRRKRYNRKLNPTSLGSRKEHVLYFAGPTKSGRPRPFGLISLAPLQLGQEVRHPVSIVAIDYANGGQWTTRKPSSPRLTFLKPRCDVGLEGRRLESEIATRGRRLNLRDAFPSERIPPLDGPETVIHARERHL